MKRLFGWLFSAWLLVAVGLCAFAALIWFIGPLVAIAERRPLESPAVRIAVILAVVGAYLLMKVLAALRALWKNRAVTQQLVAAPAANDAETAEERALRERFEQAVGTLKRARFEHDRHAVSALSARLGKRYLYELPWYIIIGAPGSGKTTALLNAGLRFPLSDGLPGQAGARVAGVGGTRHCDWWFTDQAVLIDTAGRYTTQDSHPEGDQRAWQSFLGLLKRGRPRQPINGALVTVSVPDLLQMRAEERQQHIRAVRERIQELHQQLGVRFPIYLLVTKCDLMAGFVDYLGDVDKDTRSQAWGYTSDAKSGMALDAAQFEQEFEALGQRLREGLVDRLQSERDAARRARIYGFPAQFSALKPTLWQFIEGVFAGSQFEQPVMLRGVYFVSGTQEGTPLDRMMGRLARSVQLERAVPPPNLASGRSFFLERLLKDVVFAESTLGSTNLKWERRRAWMAGAGYAGIAAALVAACGAWALSTLDNQRYVAEVAARTAQVRELLGQARPGADATADLLALLPALDAARSVADRPSGRSLWSGFGLSQDGKLQAAAEQTYTRLLSSVWLPRISRRIEDQMRAASTEPTLQYEVLKAYLMLHQPEHFDANALKAYLAADWNRQLARSLSTEQRATLVRHLDALLELGTAYTPQPEDAPLVAQVRSRLVAQPLPQRIYSRLKLLGVGAGQPEFTLAQAGGAQTALVFVRASGKPLTQGVAGLYTYDGYHRGFSPELGRVARALADEEQWVLGVTDGSRAVAGTRLPGQALPVEDEVRRLYLNDYASTWEAFIADVRLRPAGGLNQSIEIAKVLSAPGGPLVPVMKALSHHTTLAPKDPPELLEQAKAKAKGVVDKTADELNRLLGQQPTAAGVASRTNQVERIVDDRFKALRELVTSPGGQGPAPIDASVALVNEMYTQLIATKSATDSGVAPPPSAIATKVKAESARLPEPLRGMVAALSSSGTSAEKVATRTNLGQAVRSEVGEFCRQAIAGRYPFARGAERDVTPDDFARLFAPGGLMDEFFQRNLAAYVNTNTRPWSFRNIDGNTLGGSVATLIQFQRAAEIRDAFFRSGGRAPSIKLEFKPVEMDAGITEFTLDVDGQAVRYAHGPQVPSTVSWPGPKGSNQVRVTVAPPSPSGASGSVVEGPWALFRLFDRLAVFPSNVPERFTATFSIEGRRAVYSVTSSSVQNPLRLRALQEFVCPTGL